MNMTIEEFCDRHRACADGRDWAIENCVSMQDAWGKLKPDWLIWVATRKGVLTDRELRKFAVRSARQVQHLMKDPRSLKALDVAERYVEGLATDEELKVARDAAQNALEVARAAWGAAWYAAWAAADAGAAGAAAWAAADAAALDAAWAAADAGAAGAAVCAAGNAARDAQAAWLRKNTKPNFEKTKTT